jgi:signal transduction histidine kinase
MIIRLSEDLPREITVNTSFMAASDSINGDLRQICRSIYDIAINARDAMIDGGIISITTENRKIEEGNLLDLTEGDADRLFIVIKISDTGPGIEKENLGRIFDPFFTTKPVGKGRGLGLSAVYGTIQSHRGAITVDSKPGKGTTFSIYLPVA